MGKFKDLTGQKFGRLLVIKRAANRIISKRTRVFYLCECDCRVTKVKSADTLRSGRVKSCGCLLIDTSRKKMLAHGYSRHPLYATWEGIIARCENPNNSAYKWYGARGIIICKEWRESPEAFVKWGLKNGWKKGLTIDRIDNDGNYCPENCQWLTRSENTKKASRDRKMKAA